MPFVLRPPSDTVPLVEQLSALGNRRKRAILTAGTLRWIAVVVACLGLAGALDVAFHLPGFVRALFLVGTLATAGVLALRDVFAPIRRAARGRRSTRK